MASIQELLEQLRNPGDDGPPDTIYDDIAGTYTSDLEIRDAKISELSEIAQSREAEISQLKSANYDLIMASSTSEPDETEPEPEPDDASTGIDSLFETE